VEKKYHQDWKKFQGKFSLSSHSADIARILEWEDEVSKYYSDLVPSVISADIFWARYYFKLELINTKNPINGIEDEDEEDLSWDDDAPNPKDDTLVTPIPSEGQTEVIQETVSVQIIADPPDTESVSPTNDSPRPLSCSDSNPEIVQQLKEENSYLSNHILQLEKEIIQLKAELSYYHTHYPKSSAHDKVADQTIPTVVVNSNESGGESDGVMIVSLSEIQSDSDEVANRTANLIQLSKKSSDKEREKFPQKAKKGKQANDLSVSLAKAKVTSPSVVSPVDRKEAIPKLKQNTSSSPEDEEEEVGWDDAGW